MAQITQRIQYLLYTGPGGPLAGADFLSRIERITKPSANGQGQVSYLPGAAFPAFNRLDDGVIYLVISSSFPYEIPTTATVSRPTGGARFANSVFTL